VKDLAEIPDNVKTGSKFVPVKWIDQLLEVALTRQPIALTKEVATRRAPSRRRPKR